MIRLPRLTRMSAYLVCRDATLRTSPSSGQATSSSPLRQRRLPACHSRAASEGSDQPSRVLPPLTVLKAALVNTAGNQPLHQRVQLVRDHQLLKRHPQANTSCSIAIARNRASLMAPCRCAFQPAFSRSTNTRSGAVSSMAGCASSSATPLSLWATSANQPNATDASTTQARGSALLTPLPNQRPGHRPLRA